MIYNTWTLPGEPMGKQSTTHWKGRTIKPTKTRNWMAYAVDWICTHGSWKAIPSGPVQVVIVAYKSRPKRLRYVAGPRSRGKESSPVERLWCAQLPDSDNISKIVLDSLTRAGVWTDDRQVARLVVETWYVALLPDIDGDGLRVGDSPRVEISVASL